jgi:hypothetical protein
MTATTLPPGLQTPKRILFLVPIVLAALLAAGALIFALSHLSAKGPAPEVSGAPAAGPSVPDNRDAYNSSDFTEPNAK